MTERIENFSLLYCQLFFISERIDLRDIYWIMELEFGKWTHPKRQTSF